MLQLCSLLIFITLWFSLELVCKASITAQKDTFFPLPSNLKIHLYPGIINVTWDCNITNSMKKHTYHIEFQKELSKKIEISKCLYEYFVTDDMEIQIHKGLEINISSDSEWKNEYFIPEGKNNTAAENFHCDVYVSIINCSWTVGLEAPEDTQYTLAFRKTQKSQISNPKQNRIYVPCDGYRTDSFNRQIGCTLKSPKMYFNKYVYLQLVGSSNESSIQFFDTILPLHEIVILDPPRNIRWNYNSTELKITWDPPETYSNQDSHSFTYGVNINGHEVTINRQSYQLSNLNKKVNVSLRVKWNKTWSRWSEPLIIV
ncbi:granulocyte-macrophage colony-stimulating factor receptor subunit alpha-like [Mantella aurantiaca]